MTTQLSSNLLNPRPDADIMTLVSGNAVQGLQRLTQGIQHTHAQLVHLYHSIKSRNSLAPETVKHYLGDIAEHTPQGDSLEMTFLQLLLDFGAKEKEVSELRGEILRLRHNRVEASKYDPSFAQRLSRVFRKVEDWVYLTFKHELRIGQHLGDEAEDSLSEVAGDGWRELLEKEHVLLFTSVVIMELVKNVLEPCLLGINHDYLELIRPAIEESLLKNTDENVKWRTKTIDILSQNKLFWKTFKPAADALATKLFTKFSQCTQKKTCSRIDSLVSLIQDTGVAAMECQTQPSEFRFKWLPQGSRYQPKLASDANNKLGDQELKDKRRMWVVVMTVVPAVLRVEHGSGKEVVVVKARVLLKEGSRLREQGGQEGLDGRSSQDTGIEDWSGGEEGGARDDEGGSSNEDDRGSKEVGGNRDARIEQHEEEVTEYIDVDMGSEVDSRTDVPKQIPITSKLDSTTSSTTTFPSVSLARPFNKYPPHSLPLPTTTNTITAAATTCLAVADIPSYCLRTSIHHNYAEVGGGHNILVTSEYPTFSSISEGILTSLPPAPTMYSQQARWNVKCLTVITSASSGNGNRKYNVWDEGGWRAVIQNVLPAEPTKEMIEVLAELEMA